MTKEDAQKNLKDKLMAIKVAKEAAYKAMIKLEDFRESDYLTKRKQHNTTSEKATT